MNKSLKERWEEMRDRQIEGQSLHTIQPHERKAPEARGACAVCDKPVSNGRRSIELDHIDPQRLFCRLRCAAMFGVAAHKHGLRMKGKT